MVIRAMVIGAMVVAAGFAAGALGASPESLIWAAMAALTGWALVRFLHWRSEWRRIAAARAVGPLGRSHSKS
jgi:hypothetical protein